MRAREKGESTSKRLASDCLIKLDIDREQMSVAVFHRTAVFNGNYKPSSMNRQFHFAVKLKSKKLNVGQITKSTTNLQMTHVCLWPPFYLIIAHLNTVISESSVEF